MEDRYGWQLAIALLLMIASWVLGRVMAPKADCTKCGIISLRHDIKVQFFMIRHLAQKSGVTSEDLLKIEALATQALKGDGNGYGQAA